MRQSTRLVFAAALHLLVGCADPPRDLPTEVEVLQDSDADTALSALCDTETCDDSNPCTEDSCDPLSGECVHIPVQDVPCDDNNVCTTGDRCGANGGCNGGENVVCSDENPCTDDLCDTMTGCKTLLSPDGQGCSDGDPCTQGDGCFQGSCVGVAVSCAEDNEPCTQELGCDGLNGGCKVILLENGTPCEDGNLCHEGTKCEGGSCTGGLAKVCDDKNPCTDDLCSPKSGCSYTPNQDPCDDGSLCTQDDHCMQGSCQADPLDCNDDNPCTGDNCDPQSGCTFVNLNLPCEDGNPCTIQDVCTNGQCLSGAQKICDDNNACTLDACFLQSGTCTYTPLNAACDDNSLCTVDDLCQDGACVGVPISCEDANPCTSATCKPESGCEFNAKVGLCDDGNPCTSGDVCEGLVCVGIPLSCDDANPCTLDTCDTGLGCQHVGVSGVACEDEEPCTEGTECEDGACTGGTLVCECLLNSDCEGLDDGNDCNGIWKCDTSTFPYACAPAPETAVTCVQEDPTGCIINSCTPETGVCEPTVLSGGPCNDGDPCTAGEICVGTSCQWGIPEICDDGNLCTSDSCIPGEGCTFTVNSNACDDGNPCTIDDACIQGSCMGAPCSVMGLECVEGVCVDTCYGTKLTCPGLSCLDILEHEDGNVTSGTFWILPPSMEGAPFQVSCDMVTAGGGWTVITPKLAADHLDAELLAFESIDTYGLDEEGRPYCEDTTGNFTCRYTFAVPFEYQEFFLKDFAARPTPDSTPIEFDPFEYVGTLWVKSNDGTLGYTGQDGFGDITMGPYPGDGPLVSWASLAGEPLSCSDCSLPFPGGTTVYDAGPVPQSSFAICWGEAGKPVEGIFPWWTGTILVR